MRRAMKMLTRLLLAFVAATLLHADSDATLLLASERWQAYAEGTAFDFFQQGQSKPPATTPGAPSLGDLGFPTAQTVGSAQEQARLDKRSHMLRIHQRLGLITAVPLVATVILGSSAGGRETSSSLRDAHAALGSVTAGLYFTTAYFSIFAPKIKGVQTKGPIRLHKAMALIHGPGMILLPILGEMAFAQKNQGERVHGIASAHGAVGVMTAAAYGVAILSVSIKF